MPKSIFRWSITCTERILIVLLIFQIFIGVALIVMAEIFKRILLHKLPQPMEFTSTHVHMLYVQLYGGHLIIHYVFGLVYVQQLLKSYHGEIALAVRMWHWLVVVVSLDGFLVYWIYLYEEPDLIMWAEKAMSTGMKMYFTDPLIRYHWDKYQISQQCCGIRNYMDWFESEWQELDDR